MRPGHDQAHPGAPPHPATPEPHRHARKRNTALSHVNDGRDVHGDNWVAIVVVAIIFGVFLVIVFIVICCLSHGGKAAVESASWDPPVEGGGGGTAEVERRYNTAAAALRAQGLSEHLSSVSMGMVFPVARKFAPTGKKIE